MDQGRPTLDRPTGTEAVAALWPDVLETRLGLTQQVRLVTRGSRNKRQRTVTRPDGSVLETTATLTTTIQSIQVQGPLPQHTSTWLEDPHLLSVTLTMMRGDRLAVEAPEDTAQHELSVHPQHGQVWRTRTAVSHDGRTWRLGPALIPGQVLGYHEDVRLEVMLTNLGLPPPGVQLWVVPVTPYLQGRSVWLDRWEGG